MEEGHRLKYLCKRIEINDPILISINLGWSDSIFSRLFRVNFLTFSRKREIDREIGVEGSQALAKALQRNTTVTALDLRRNNIGDRGVQALSKMLKSNTVLTSLDLAGNGIGEIGAQALAKALESNATLTLLKLNHNENIEASAAKALAKALKNNTALISLDLGYCEISNGGARALSKTLGSNTMLRSLDLSHANIGSTGAQALFKALERNATLTLLDIRNNAIDVGSTEAEALFKALASNATLTSLDLSSNNIGNTGIKALGEALKKNTTLALLKLNENKNISDAAVQALAKGLKNNTTLISLEFSHNNVSFTEIQVLAKALEHNIALTSLNLKGNNISSAGVPVLAKMLENNATLVSLNLDYNNIGNTGVKTLTEALKSNFTLTKLNTYDGIDTQIDKVLKETIKKYLKRNQALRDRFRIAAEKGEIGKIKQLLKPKANINDCSEKDGMSALHLAAKNGHLAVVKFLLKKGALAEVKNHEDKTPLEVARQSQQKAVVKYLASYLQAGKKKSPSGKKAATNVLKRISCKELQFVKALGQGAFGKVFEGRYAQKRVALKQIDDLNLTDKAKQEAEREARILARLDSPWVVHLFGVCLESKFILVLEYCSGGSLENCLQSHQQIAWGQRWQWSMEIASGLDYLHSQQIVHRDLAARNVLLDEKGQAKLADFGLSETRTFTSGSLQQASSDKISLAWTAPELLVFGAKSTKAGDIYSLGVTLWEIASRQKPLKNINHPQSVIIDAIRRGHRETIQKNETPENYASLIEQCWQAKPEFRPTAAKVVKYLHDRQPKAGTAAMEFFKPDMQATMKKALAEVLEKNCVWQCELYNSTLTLTLPLTQPFGERLESLLAEGMLGRIKTTLKSNIGWLKGKDMLRIKDNQLIMTFSHNSQAQALKKLLEGVGLVFSNSINTLIVKSNIESNSKSG